MLDLIGLSLFAVAFAPKKLKSLITLAVPVATVIALGYAIYSTI